MDGVGYKKTAYELVIAFVFLVILSVLIIVYHNKKAPEDTAQNSLQNSSQNISANSGSNVAPIQKLAKEENYCTEPVKYSVGGVDPRFNLSEEALRKILLETENIWENPVEKNLFDYDPDAALKVNLIFDERQQGIIEAKESEERLADLKSFHQQIIDKHENIEATYRNRLNVFNDRVADYERRVADYNSSVEYWKDKGGATQKAYDELKSQKKYLAKTFDNLNKERKAINDLVNQANSLVESENSTVSNFNELLDTYKSKFGNSTEFDKGVFNGSSIAVFEFKDKNDLRLALTHEFGHVLGISHLQTPKSIMYYLMGEQDLNAPRLSIEDLNALRAACQLH